MLGTRAGRTAALAWITATAVLMTGCGSSSDEEGDSAGPVTLTVGVFGDSFTPELYRAYEAAHPGVKIKEVRADYGTHHNNLQAHLTSGAGAADVELVEIGQISGYLGQSDKFVNFKDTGVDVAQWTEAKVAQASTSDGSRLIGLPTDTGGLAICYRTDLFEKAGLPTKPDEVSALFPTWEKYVEAGRTFLAAAPKGTVWFDAAGNLFNGILGNEAQTYYDSSGNVVAGQNPAVKKAWDLTVEAVKAGESAKLSAFSAEWNTGFQRGQFATVTCPAWMLGYIRTNAPKTEGKWDIATVPGGSGNWGGSFATVPTQGKHQKQAVELATWLTASEQAITIYKTLGNFPSAVRTWTSPEVADAKDAFFSDAPVGTIFPASLEKAPVQVYGPQWGIINTAFGNALTTVEKGTDPEKAWSKALKDVAAAAG